PTATAASADVHVEAAVAADPEGAGRGEEVAVDGHPCGPARVLRSGATTGSGVVRVLPGRTATEPAIGVVVARAAAATCDHDAIRERRAALADVGRAATAFARA